MTRQRLTAAIEPNLYETRIVVMDGQDEVLRAVLGPLDQAHSRGVATFLEGLSRWHRRRLTVAFCADGADSSFVSLLCSGLEDEGDPHYRLVAVPHAYSARGTLFFEPDPRFGDLRRMALAGGLL